EVSPSGQGLKIWCRAAMERNLGKVEVSDGGVEMYSHARFFTVTGLRYREAPLQVEHHQIDVDTLLQHLRRPARALVGSNGRIPHGRQHWTLVSIAGTLRRRGVCQEGIEACLQVVNRLQCERPGAPKDISRIAEAAGRWPDGNTN
ncbi:MAG: primase C-terminal domain-containing protein, partial [Acidobacteria bacterium]|nr:primase C-terminal domain-containing protein [Acidobacteriota bacterium]